MNNFFSKLLNLNNDHNTDEKQDENISPLQSEANDDSNAASDTDGTDDTDRYISALLALLADFYGTDKLVIKAGKMDALQLVRSPEKGERVLALQRIILENPTIKEVPLDEEIPGIIDELTEHFSEIVARRSLEDDIEKKVAEKLEVAQSTLRNWENGHTDPKLPQFMMLCRLYDVSCDNIFFEQKIS